jgi:hypothetical protein
MKRKHSLNNANAEQLKILHELRAAAVNCPPVTDREAYQKYHTEVMQPIRDRVLAAAAA